MDLESLRVFLDTVDRQTRTTAAEARAAQKYASAGATGRVVVEATRDVFEGSRLEALIGRFRKDVPHVHVVVRVADGGTLGRLRRGVCDVALIGGWVGRDLEARPFAVVDGDLVQLVRAPGQASKGARLLWAGFVG